MARTRKRSKSSGRALRARHLPAWAWLATWLVGMSALVLLASQVVVPRVEAREGEIDARRAEADQRLLESVHGALAPLVSLPVRLTVVDGEVTLEGETASDTERDALVAAVRDHAGVVEVRDELTVVGDAPPEPDAAPSGPDVAPPAPPAPDAPPPDAAPPEPAPEPDPAPSPPPPPEPAAGPADAPDVPGIALEDEFGEPLLSDEESLALAQPFPPPPGDVEPDPDAGPDAGPESAPEPLAATPDARAPDDAPPTRPASLSVRVADGALRLAGSLAAGDEGALSRFVGPATEAFDPRYVENVVQTAGDVEPAGWLAPLEALLVPLAALGSPGIDIDAERLTLSGVPPTDAARTAALDAAATLFPDHAVADRMAAGDDAPPDPAPAPSAPAAPPARPTAAPAPEPAPPAGTAAERRAALSAAFEALPDRRILFESGTASFTDGSAARVDAIAELFRRHPDVRVEIEGHTDASGPARDNLALSQRRANAVRDALVEAGVARDRLVAYGYGEGVPLVDNSTPEGRAQNRRIEFRF